MENEEDVEQIDVDRQESPRLSALAVGSLAFGTLGPLSAGAMWVLSFNDFLTAPNPLITGVFSCGLAWILGLVFAVKALDQIKNSHSQLLGKEYAIAGAVISGLWLALILTTLILPALFYVG